MGLLLIGLIVLLMILRVNLVVILTPPLGLNLIVAMTAFKESFGLICKAAIPFVLLMLGCLLLISFQPWVAMVLVN